MKKNPSQITQLKTNNPAQTDKLDPQSNDVILFFMSLMFVCFSIYLNTS